MGKTQKENSRKIERLILVLAFAMAIILLRPQIAKADIASGKWGTCQWTISDDGVLTIGAGTGEDIYLSDDVPWNNQSSKIRSIKAKGQVVLPQTCQYLFKDMTNAINIDLSNFDSSKTTYMSYMFAGCSKLQSINMKLNTSKVISMYCMFADCVSLQSLNLSGFDTSSLAYASEMFRNCSSLKSLDLSSFDTGNVTSMQSMFNGCSGLTSLDLSNFNTGNVTEMNGLFSGCSKLTSLDLSSFNTGNVTDMSYMFSGCSGLKSLDVSSFNTGKVENMSDMFNGCSSLMSLDLLNFNTRKVKGMSYMFNDCSSLETLGISNFETANVQMMNFMFAECYSLTALDVKRFDTSSVNTMQAMFKNCSGLKELDVSGFNTKNVTDMEEMFRGCANIQLLDMSSFNTSKVVSSRDVFFENLFLKTLILGPESGLTSNDGSSFGLENVVPGEYNNFSSLYDGKVYTGNWTKSSPYNHADSISGADLEAKYATNNANFGNFEKVRWVWEIPGADPQYLQNHQSDDGITNGKHNVVNPSSSIKTDDQISAFALDSEGNKTGYWTKLDDETWTYTFFVYKANVPWRIYEDSLSGYSGNYTNASPLNITDGSSEAVITNTSDKIAAQKYGSLKITKKLSSGTSNVKFSFEVSLTDENGNALSGNNIFGSIPFSDGKATLSLKAGESVGISGIPVGYHYKIKELPTSGYRQESFSNSAGVITEGETEAICTNKLAPNRETPSNPDAPKETVPVVINKICSSQSDRFKFWINISGLTAEENVEVRVKITASDTEKTVSYSPDSSGEINAEADISGGGSITLSNVPVGAEYQITEQTSLYLASYKITDGNAKALVKDETAANTSVNTALSTFKETADSGEAVIITYTNEKPKYPVSFTKRDDKDDFVEGALLEVLTSDGKAISSWTTAAGESEELMLEPGDYTLKETSAPSGYTKAADIAFSVSDDGNVISDGTEIPDSEIEMIDSRTELSVQISKVDASGYPLPGAALKISDISGSSIDIWTSDNKPHEVKLSFGQSYVLSEVSAPTGYEKAADIRISVSADGTLSVDGKALSLANVEMVDTRKTYILPSTGGSGNNLHLLVFAVSASLFAAGVLSSKKGRKKSS